MFHENKINTGKTGIIPVSVLIIKYRIGNTSNLAAKISVSYMVDYEVENWVWPV
jgi:hypothetical protein